MTLLPAIAISLICGALIGGAVVLLVHVLASYFKRQDDEEHY